MCSGYCNKISQTRWPLNNRNLFLTVLEAEQCVAPSFQLMGFLAPNVVGGARGLCGVSFIGVLISLRLSPEDLSAPKGPSPNAIALDTGISTKNVGA